MSRHYLNHIMLANMEIMGYSVGGDETVVAVPSLDVCFDFGKAPDEILPINNVLLSHGHMDHAAGIAYYFSQRNFREMAPGTVLLPANLVDAVEELLDCWGRMDGTRPPAQVISMVAGREYPLRRDLFVRAFATSHCYGSLGYTVIERRHKLKAEFHELTGPQIAELKRQGTEITYQLDIPLVSYLGDTTSGDFEKLDFVRKSKVLIAECTFFDPDHHDRARAGRHYHFDRLAKVLPEFENEFILLTHLSRRTELRYARNMVKKNLPRELSQRIYFLMERKRHYRNTNNQNQ